MKDTFKSRRLIKFARDFREKHAKMPTLKDIEEEGFTKSDVDVAVKDGTLKELYTNLTSGAIVKVYKA